MCVVTIISGNTAIVKRGMGRTLLRADALAKPGQMQYNSVVAVTVVVRVDAVTGSEGRRALRGMPGKIIGKALRRLNSARHYMMVPLYRAIRGIDPDKVVFSCFEGRAYGDNPRCISERLHQRRPRTKIVWLLKPEALEKLKDRLPDYVVPVDFTSNGAIEALATARVWVDNFTKYRYLVPQRGRQFYVQTWHGDRAIKRICYDLNLPGDHRRVEERCARVLTGSTFGEGLYRTAFRYRGEYLRAGAPRNDILVENDPNRLAAVRRGLGIPEGALLLLYAPTYREKGAALPRESRLDMERLLNCLERSTGAKWMCLFRAHYLSAAVDLQAVRDRIVDVTAYDDMSELLLAADMLLTDYSSCAFDYILTDRPALFYIPDWQAYVASRGVYFDIRQTPMLTAADQQGLEALIGGMTPERARRNCAEIREYFGYYESGRATDAACDYIIERLGSRGAMPD